MKTIMKAAATVAFAAALSVTPAMAQGNPSGGGVRAGGNTIGGISVGGGMKQGGGGGVGGFSGGTMKQGGAMSQGGGIKQGGSGGVAIAPNNWPNRGLGDGRRRQAGNWAANGDGRHYGNKHRRHRGVNFYVYGAPYDNDYADDYDDDDCGRFWRRYQQTGRPVWKRRYYNCIG